MGREAHDVVIVHDYLGQFGGAERVVQELCRLFPAAPLYTSYYAPHRTYESFASVDVRQSFLGRAPGIATHYRAYLLAYPLAFSSLRLPECRVVLSSSSAFAKGVRVPAGAVHVCYCYTPMRFAWDFDTYVNHDRSMGRSLRPALRSLMAPLRRWDSWVNRRVDQFLTSADYVAQRIMKVYGRDAIVIPPPVDVNRFRVASQVEDFYLVISRLAAYKRVDLAVEACARTGRRLVVVGEGPDRARLESLAGPSVSFLGRVDDGRVVELLATCRALLFCGEEDFGITPLEAMASGRPVIALGRGGALETVVDGQTGLFFQEPTVDALTRCLTAFEEVHFDPQRCVGRAHEFGPDRFRAGIMAAIDCNGSQ